MKLKKGEKMSTVTWMLSTQWRDRKPTNDRERLSSRQFSRDVSSHQR